MATLAASASSADAMTRAPRHVIIMTNSSARFRRMRPPVAYRPSMRAVKLQISLPMAERIDVSAPRQRSRERALSSPRFLFGHEPIARAGRARRRAALFIGGRAARAGPAFHAGAAALPGSGCTGPISSRAPRPPATRYHLRHYRAAASATRVSIVTS